MAASDRLRSFLIPLSLLDANPLYFVVHVASCMQSIGHQICRLCELPCSRKSNHQQIYDLPDADQTLPSIISAKQAIGRCYPKMSHEMAIYELNQKDVKADETDNSYILTYWLAGVSDVAIAFRVDRSGHVIEAFEYSTM